jgi:serine/threonine protein kinase
MTHPNICRYLGFAKFEGLYVMILEYIPGKDLRKIVGPMQLNRDPMEPARAIEIIANVCSGLTVAHKVNLLHRDIKPDNILIHQGDGVPKILDFGVSKMLQSSSGIGSGTVVGTFPYMAPEALKGHASIASDIWSLSVMFYELVTGRLPFRDENLFELKRKIDSEEPVAPHELNSAVDESLSALIMQGLEKDAKNRFESAQNLQDALEARDLDAVVPRLRDLFQSGSEEEAEQQAMKVLERMQRQPRIYMLIGEFRNRRQQFLRAEEIVRLGMKECADHAGLHFYLAPALWSQGGAKQREAIAALERALQLGLQASQARQARNMLRSWQSEGGHKR